MEALEQIALTGQVTARAVPSAFAPPLGFVTLAGFALPAAAIVAIANFSHPLVSPFMVPAVTALGGERALHYPANLVMLPDLLLMLGRMTSWLGLTLLIGWAATVAAYGPRGVSVGSALLGTFQRLPRLLVAGVPLALLHGVAAQIGTQAAAELPRRLIGAVLHLAVGFALESAVLTVAVFVVPLVVRADLPLRAVPAAFKRAFHWGAVGAPAFGIALATTALVSRVVCARAQAVLAATRPDGVTVLVLAAAFVATVGAVVFAAGSEVLAAALDEGWE